MSDDRTDPAGRTSGARLWVDFVFLLRVLWVCRVSVVSAVGGVALFAAVVQAQNLLADTAFDHAFLRAVRHWSAFFFGLFFLWAFPVHYAARRTLNEDSWIATAALRRHLDPWELKRICFETRAQHPWSITWVPRILGLIPFIAVALGLWGAYKATAGAGSLTEGREALELIEILSIIDAGIAAVFVAFVILRQGLVQRAVRRMNQRRTFLTGGDGSRFFQRLSTISLATTTLVFAFAYFAPIWIAAFAPRAALIPLLFGSLVLFLGWVVRMSYRHGVPYLLGLVIVAAVATGSNVAFNDVRSIRSDGPAAGAGRQVDVGAAITRWRNVNGCGSDITVCPPVLLVAADGGASRAAFLTATVVGEVLDEAAGADPNPPGGPAASIFAMSGVSGGAYGAAVIRAALADAAEGNGSPPCRHAHPTWYRFAHHDGDAGQSSWRDCLQSLVSGDFLSPVFVGLAFRDNLAPPVERISKRLKIDDRAVLLEEAWERHYDYVVNGGSRILQTGRPCGRWSDGRGLCRPFGYLDMQPNGTRWLPILALNGTSVETGRRIITTDLTSTAAVAGERPEVLYPQAYDLFEMRSTACPAKPADDTKGNPCTTPSGHLDAPDIFLSTAALTSARFPIVSPAGAVWTRNADRHGDRIVDGGYFENSGLTTTLDIARVLHERGLAPIVLSISNEPEAVDLTVDQPPRPGVTPTIGRSDVAGLRNRILGIVSAPVQTLLGTRDGHGAEARDLMVRTLDQFTASSSGGPQGIAFFHVGMAVKTEPFVAAAASPSDRRRCAALRAPIEMTKVSMSWWLSYAVQADIDAQLCTRDNQTTLANLMTRLRARHAS